VTVVNNTSKRYLALSEVDPNNAELYNMAADAYEILIRIRTVQGLKNANSDRYIPPEVMDKMDCLQLRNSKYRFKFKAHFASFRRYITK
jgi:CBS domain-containing protein